MSPKAENQGYPRNAGFPLSDPAHTANNGMRSKGPDSSCAPLCREHHQEYDAGRKAFEAKYQIGMRAVAAGNWNRFMIYQDAIAAIRRTLNL